MMRSYCIAFIALLGCGDETREARKTAEPPKHCLESAHVLGKVSGDVVAYSMHCPHPAHRAEVRATGGQTLGMCLCPGAAEAATARALSEGGSLESKVAP